MENFQAQYVKNQNKEQTEDKRALNEQREDFAVEIRKVKRDEILLKNRDKQMAQNNGVQLQYNELNGQQQNNNVQVQQDTYSTGIWAEYKQDNLKDYSLQLVQNQDNSELVKNAIKMLKIATHYSTCNKYQINLEYIIGKEVHKIFFKLFIKYQNNNEIIYPLLLLISNFLQGSTSQTQKVVEQQIHSDEFKGDGAEFYMNLLKKYINENNLQYLTQIVYGIGNIVGTKMQYREYYIKSDLYESIFDIMIKFPVGIPDHMELSRHLAWTLCSLTRDQPPSDYQFNLDKLQILLQSMKENHDDEFQSDIIWSVLQILQLNLKLDSLNSNSAIIRNLIDCQILSILEKTIFNVNMPIILPGIRIYGILMKGDVETTQQIIETSHKTLFPRIFQLMDHSMRIVRLETIKLINIISKKEISEINKLLNQQFIQKIIYKSTRDDTAVVRESLKAMNNLFSTLQEEQLFLLVNQDVYDILSINLSYPDMIQDSDMVLYALQIVYKMIYFYKNSETLKLGKRDQTIQKMIEEQGILQKVENLQTHPNEGIYKQCIEIIELFQQGEDDQYGLYCKEGMDMENN